MTRLRGTPRHVRGWVDGILERAEPDVSAAPGQAPAGTLEACLNFLITRAGRLAVRNGSQVAQTLHNAASGAMHMVLGVWPFTQTGAVAVAHYLSGGVPENNLYRLTSNLAFYGANEGASRHALSWAANTSGPPRPVVTELFEKMYLADATLDFTKRNGLTSVDVNGTVTTPTYSLDGGGAVALKPYGVFVMNGVLFGYGYDSGAVEEKAILRHSRLGTSPDAVGGWDINSYAIIGAKGQRITAGCPGRTVALVAKANELYRISGAGRALDGWQYPIQQVENTQGYGCSNPYALCFAEGHWYGVGEAGPFRTDGVDVEPLVSLRRDSWPKISNLRTAWVTYWPERRIVKFGFNVTPVDAGRSSTYPFSVWNFDIDREVWSGDEKFSADLHLAQAIPSLTATGGATTPGPSAAPTTPLVDDSAATLTTGAYSWTNGDATASSEIWLRTDLGGYAYLATVSAAVATYTIPSLTQASKYWVKVRHIRDGLYSDFTAEIAVYTRLPAPTLTGALTTGITRMTLYQTVAVDVGTSLVLEVNTGAGFGAFQTVTNPLSGVTYTMERQADGFSWRAKLVSTNWPAVIQSSAYSSTVVI